MLVNCNWLSLIVIKRDQLYELRSIAWIAIDSLNCDRLPELRSIIWVVIDCTSCDLLYELQHCPTILRIGSVTIGLLYSQTRWTASFISSSSHHWSPVRYDLMTVSCTIRSRLGFLYDTISSCLCCTISISEPPLLRYSVLGELRSLST